MFNFIKKKLKGKEKPDNNLNEEPTKQEDKQEQSIAIDTTNHHDLTKKSDENSIQENTEKEETGFFSRLKDKLSKTRKSLGSALTTLIAGKKEIDAELLEKIETRLLVSDIGPEVTDMVINKITEKLNRKELKEPEKLVDALKDELFTILSEYCKQLETEQLSAPIVILLIGVNGAGKTTTAGKLAAKYINEGKSVMLAAGDTFRAAAVEQLQEWGKRVSAPVVSQHIGADSASVLYDAYLSAKAKNIDILIADTAGRLHNKENLMEELKKIKRVLGKLDSQVPQETLLVLDSTIGQNAIAQAKAFHENINVNSIAVTKLDGTAKGGVIFAVADKFKLPIRFIGVGEKVSDLREFNAKEFVDALFDVD